MSEAAGGEMIRVLAVDDEPMVLDYLRTLFDAAPQISVVAVAQDGADALEQTLRTHPDVVLMDLRLPSVDGIQATRAIRALDHPPVVVAMTTLDTDEHVLDALDAGAAGFILKTTPADQLVAMVTAAARGAAVLSPDTLHRLRQRAQPPAPPADPRLDALPPRDREVLDLVASGATNADIAARLYLSESTVKSVVSRLMTALDCANRTQLALLAAGHPRG